MATVYILYSKSIDKYYTGSCNDLKKRLEEHAINKYSKGFTHRASDWQVYFIIDNLNYQQARKIELHFKRMKSRKYVENLLIHPEIIERLKDQYN